MTRTAAPTAVHTLRVTGMTCAACERRVSRALGRLPGVESASANAHRGRVVLTGALPPAAELDGALQTAGYRLGAPPWISRDRRTWATAAAGALAVAGLGWLAARSGLSGWTPAASLSGPGLALLVGLAAGVSTCMALVGGLVLGVSAASTQRGRGALRAQLAFTAGRWAAFAAGGAALGSLGRAAQLPDGVLAGGMLVAAVVMVVLGVRLTGLSPRIGGFALTLPASWTDRFGLAGRRGAAAAGAATFLLPCGFTQAMQLYAISSGSAGQAAAVMTAFAVGTTPGLLGLGLLGGLTTRGAVPAAAPWPRLVGVVVLAFALVTATGGLRALGLAVPGLPGLPGSGTGTVALAPTAVTPNVRLEGGAQVVTLSQGPDGYDPADSVVWAGLPIRWAITSTATYTCSSMIRVPSLDVRINLAPVGLHTVDLPALPVGTTSFTCVMGMYSGTLRAIPRQAAG